MICLNLAGFQGSKDYFTTLLVVGVTVTVFLLILATIIVVLAIFLLRHSKQVHKLKKSLSNVHTDLYDKIQLSPSTGQSEVFPETESESINVFTSITLVSHNMQGSKITETHSDQSNTKDCTYAVVDKTKKNKLGKMVALKPGQDNTSQKDINPNTTDPVNSDAIEKQRDQPNHRQGNLEEMYATVHKRPKNCEEQDELAPSVPSHTVESLYTAVQKNRK